MSQTICHRRRKSASEFGGDDLGFHVPDFIRNTVGVKKKLEHVSRGLLLFMNQKIRMILSSMLL